MHWIFFRKNKYKENQSVFKKYLDIFYLFGRRERIGLLFWAYSLLTLSNVNRLQWADWKPCIVSIFSAQEKRFWHGKSKIRVSNRNLKLKIVTCTRGMTSFSK